MYMCMCIYREAQIFANGMSMLCRTQVYEGSGIGTRLSWSQVILKRLFREIYEFQTRSKAFSTYHFTHYFVKYNGTV